MQWKKVNITVQTLFNDFFEVLGEIFDIYVWTFRRAHGFRAREIK